MAKTINVVEPTLMTEAGHCYSFISSFCCANKGSHLLRLWISRQAELTFSGKNIFIMKYFFRKIRRLQSFFLYKHLLAKPEKLFITTAGRTDLFLINWASRSIVPPNKVYLYFHWLNAKENKLASLREIARKQPNLNILGPTLSVIKLFQEAGFSNAHVVPYPISKREVSPQPSLNKFSYLLYAGAARRDKGFSHVVDLVAYMQEHALQIPIMLQISPEHYGKYDAIIQSDIIRLQNIGYSHLLLCPDTLNTSEYTALFAGAICIQLYDPSDFYDRVSGVTLDAFSSGCPIVATSGTWSTRMVQRFDAGVVVEDMSSSQILSAAQQVISEYERFNKNALMAGKVLQEENSADALFSVLAS